MMSYCNTGGGGGGGNSGGVPLAASSGSPTPPQLSQCGGGQGSPTPPSVLSQGHQQNAGNGDQEDDLWRGHSIAALRRRASELNAAIPSYLQINYDTHNNSVY